MFGKKLRHYRIDLGMTINQLANYLNVSPSFVCSIERGRKNVSNQFCDQISSYMNLSDQHANELRNLAVQSRKYNILKLKNFNHDDYSLMQQLADNFYELRDVEIKTIKEIIERFNRNKNANKI